MTHWEAIWNGRKGHTLEMQNVYALDELQIDGEAMELHTRLESVNLWDLHSLVLLKHCPNLDRVWWENDAYTNQLQKMLLNCLRKVLLGQPESLHISKARAKLPVSTLRARNMIKQVSVKNGNLENTTVQVLIQHFATLQILFVPTYIKDAGTFAPTVLASSPPLADDH